MRPGLLLIALGLLPPAGIGACSNGSGGSTAPAPCTAGADAAGTPVPCCSAFAGVSSCPDPNGLAACICATGTHCDANPTYRGVGARQICVP